MRLQVPAIPVAPPFFSSPTTEGKQCSHGCMLASVACDSAPFVLFRQLAFYSLEMTQNVTSHVSVSLIFLLLSPSFYSLEMLKVSLREPV